MADGPKEEILTAERLSALFGAPLHLARRGEVLLAIY